MRFNIFQRSIQGPRLYNEDRIAYSYSKEALLMVLADGMGGHHHGDVAADLAVKMLISDFQQAAKPTIKQPNDFLKAAIQKVHEALVAIKHQKRLSESPRTTIVAAIVQHQTAYIAHVGDSRLYHFRKKQVVFRTEDHSVVQALFRKQMIRLVDIAHHPDKHKIYNCLGGEVAPNIEISAKRELRDGDYLMLCSDGLSSVLSDEDICKILYAAPITNAVNSLISLAENISGEMGDNVSVIALQLNREASDPGWVSTGMLPLGKTSSMFFPTTQSLPEGVLAGDADLSEDEIERRIAEIQLAISKKSE